MPPSDFSMLKKFIEKRIPENARRTGCETAVWITLPQKFGV